jgi:predicted RNase H-like HicB family nuclease
MRHSSPSNSGENIKIDSAIISSYPFTIRSLSAEEGGGFAIEYPDLPGCISDGDTPENALQNGSDAVNRICSVAPRTAIPFRNRLEGGHMLPVHSVVALLEDSPQHGLVRGQAGTIVDVWTPDIYEVEFCDLQGKAYAHVALRAEQMMQLHYDPLQSLLDAN